MSDEIKTVLMSSDLYTPSYVILHVEARKLINHCLVNLCRVGRQEPLKTEVWSGETDSDEDMSVQSSLPPVQRRHEPHAHLLALNQNH